MLASPARGSDPVNQLALNLDSQTLDSICQLDLSHLGNPEGGTEDIGTMLGLVGLPLHVFEMDPGY